jgi:AcrR family transcriptional regulator
MTREARRASILEAAAGVFVAKGYRQSSIDDIIDAAGISRGTFYLYFDSRKDAFIELIESYFDQLTRVLEENHRRLEETFEHGWNIMRTWRENILSILRFHHDNPDLTCIVYREAGGTDEDFSERFSELTALSRRIYRDAFQAMADRALLREEDIDLVTTINVGATIYVITEHLLPGAKPDIEKLADKLVEYHTRALAPYGIDTEEILRGVLKTGTATPVLEGRSSNRTGAIESRG